MRKDWNYNRDDLQQEGNQRDYLKTVHEGQLTKNVQTDNILEQRKLRSKRMKKV